MHRIAAIPGGWNPQNEGVVFIEQTPAPIVFLTAADTDIQAIAQAWDGLPAGFPAVRVVSLLALQQELTIDTYAETVLAEAAVIVIRLLGGVSYWSYGLEVVQEGVARSGAKLVVLPGDDRPDPMLMSRSTLPMGDVNQIYRYLTEGGVTNFQQALRYIATVGLGQAYEFQPPQPVPKVGVYPVSKPDLSVPFQARVGLIFYRAHYLAGNTAAIAALCQALIDRHLEPIPIYISSLRDPDVQAELLTYFQPKDEDAIQVLLNTTSFSLITPLALNTQWNATEETADAVEFWRSLDIPVLQVILSGGTEEQWRSQLRGLSPRDTAMNVALPEVDGRIITRAVSFKAVQTQHPVLQTEVIGYQPIPDRIEFVADLAAHWVRLRQTPVSDRRVALILANYPSRDGRLANGVGLDTPASCVAILQALQAAGYGVEGIPESGDELIQRLTQGVTNDPEGREIRSIYQVLSLSDYQVYLKSLPVVIQQEIYQRWGNLNLTEFAIAGLQFGNVFVGIQPARGYDQDPALNYHAPDLEPTHEYLAFYHWVRWQFAAQAVVHVGKHGNLEWLPGKSVALAQTCYPEVALGAMPHFYPFIVNDPGEGAQAKRRSQAVIIDHLTPPMTRADLYGELQALENLVDEYYEAINLDPSRMRMVKDKIVELLRTQQLDLDLGISLTTIADEFENQVLNHLDRSLCELKDAQIRDGLHILGLCPQGAQLRDLMFAIARHPQAGRSGLLRAIAEALNVPFDPLTADPAASGSPLWRTVAEGIDALTELAIVLIEAIVAGVAVDDILGNLNALNHPLVQAIELSQSLALRQELQWIHTILFPALQQTSMELTALLQGLQGGYIPSGPSGAPTRGRPEVLPTGRNFYSVDIRAVPTESAWDVGRKAAEALIERYTQEQGDYPKTLGLSIWGTSTMRTGGDDLAQALALLGVRPLWESASRRVVDFEILPLSVLGRPRVDVTLRISGFFRDAFPNLIDLFDQAVSAIAALDEPESENPLAAKVKEEQHHWLASGLTQEEASLRSRFRIFGSKPGAYGAGLQGLIESQNWVDDQDLAQAYINWSSYAYTAAGVGQTAPEAFAQRLKAMQIVLQNQDNREHDLLDSDDYYQFQGGLTAAVRSQTGQQPMTYFGDHSLPEQPKVRSLQEEIAKVYRSRVVNPKWIAGMMRHGYKGAFELAATVDFLFAYDATAHCVADHMYQGVAEAYLFDPTVQAFIQSSNPWVLRDMAERLLEAHQRGLWEQPSTETLEQLTAIILEAEGAIEANLS
ncbi:MAG: cobaltochelatase subunit CobN [Synechococcales bacterium]|nr:cobaltochelatase subunit CobN [Synechococcales bacterium]